MKYSNLFVSVLTLSSIFGLANTSAWAVSIAIVDSGTDFDHVMIHDNAWKNRGLGDTRYSKGIHGWNFSENNELVLDPRYMGKFSADVPYFFEVQLRIMLGTATDQDKEWMEAKKSDSSFIRDLSTFSNFVHGTHVSGIAAKSAPQAQIMAAKIIATEPKQVSSMIAEALIDFASFHLAPLNWSSDNSGTSEDDTQMRQMMDKLAAGQATKLEPIGTYVGATQMRVANCSFGTGFEQAKNIANLVARSLLSRELTDAETDKYAHYFMDQMMNKGSVLVTSAPKTLFVIAAGNDGTDNDQNPAFPASLRMQNTITVAATRDFERIASFSNFGYKSVDIAAPGVGIRSSIPSPTEKDTLMVSGTSQAAPYIANLAGRILDINPRLSLADVKQILMQTVDKKSFLRGKVVSEGIANENRATTAARNSLDSSISLAIAIERSQQMVADLSSSLSRLSDLSSGLEGSTSDGDPIAMPSLF